MTPIRINGNPIYTPIDILLRGLNTSRVCFDYDISKNEYLKRLITSQSPDNQTYLTKPVLEVYCKNLRVVYMNTSISVSKHIDKNIYRFCIEFDKNPTIINRERFPNSTICGDVIIGRANPIPHERRVEYYLIDSNTRLCKDLMIEKQ